MEEKPIAEIGIGDRDVEDVLFPADVKRRLKPGLVAILVDLFFNVLEDRLPRAKLFFILHSGSLNFHRNIHNCGKPCSLAEGGSTKAREIIAFRKTDFKRVKKRRGMMGLEVEADPELGLELAVGLESERVRDVGPAQFFNPFDMNRESQQEELDAPAVGADGVQDNRRGGGVGGRRG